MIKNIHIGNYALIDKTNIELEKGFTIITGETGAGKSILLGAIGLTLGQRAMLQPLWIRTENAWSRSRMMSWGTIYSNGLLIMTWIMMTRWS